ncbi:MAG: cell division protein FtsZ [Bacteroidota bacterium]
MMQFDLPKELSSIIKVIGVGGGGSNAVNHMYRQGINGVDFIVCNTDKQALDMSPVPLKIQLGKALTQGLGAGMLPEVGRNAAMESINEIKEILGKGTKMLFITAGMGKGTGTGAAPVIAQIAREMGILTVGIVTIPFAFEGPKKRQQAEAGIEEMKKYIDSLLIICNERLREMYGNLTVVNAFAHADDVLSDAAKSIAEIISHRYHVNVDFNDVQTVMKESGVSIMGTASASGEGRAINAVEMALNSPLLNDNDITGARYVLMNVTSGAQQEVTMDELGEITDYIQNAAGNEAEIVTGYGVDPDLGDKINVTIIATGFKTKAISGFQTKKKSEKKVLKLDDNVNTAEPVAEKKEETPVQDALEPVLKSELEQAPVTEEVTTFKEEVTLSDIVDPLEPVLKTVEVKAEEPKAEEAADIVNDAEETVIVDELTPAEEPVLIVKEEVVAEVKTEEPVIEAPVMEIPVVETPVVETPAAETTLVETPVGAETKSEEIVFEIEKAPESVIEFSKEPELVNTPEEPVAAEETPQVSEVKEEVVPVISEAKAEEPVAEVKPEVTELKKQEPVAEIQPEVKAEEKNEVVAEQKKEEEEEKKHIPASQNLSSEEQIRKAKERIMRLKELSMKLKTPNGLAELENEPAYKRKNINLENVPHSSESEVSKYTLTENEEKKVEIKPNNSFLHDNVD